MSVVFGSGELGQIIGGSTRIQLTWDDLLWAARMITGECGVEASSVHGAAVLWCMASRMIQSRSRSYTRLIQAYSQPINPRWRADGDFCRIGGRYHDRDECSPARLEARERLSTLSWDQISSDVQDLVYKWATGQINNPVPKAVHFAVPAVTTSGARRNQTGGDGNWQFVWDSKGRTSIDPVARGGNVFVSTNRSREWTDRFVKLSFLDREASDSNVAEVAAVAGATRASGGGERSRPLAEAALEREPPPNNILDRTSEITSDRLNPPTDPQYDYAQAFSDYQDPRASSMLSQEETERVLKINSSRFKEQVDSLKSSSNLEMTSVVPILQITTERDEGGIINLNEEIFSRSPIETYSENQDLQFPERPIASLVSFEVTVQEPSVGGVTGIQMGTLHIKVHNCDAVTRSHPLGKYIAYMMSQGFVIRVKYGVEGFSYSGTDRQKKAFQWKEEDFFVTQYDCTIHNDKTMDLTISVMPATNRLMNQLKIGQSIPVSSLGTITSNDINDIVNQVASNDPESTESEVQELRRRLTLFVNQLNSARESPAVGFEERADGTLGSQFHAALTNREIFESDEAISSVPVNNMVEALQTIQAVLLTRRFETILRNDCYRYTHRSVSRNVVDIGPLIFNIVKPEIDYIFATVARNQIEIGEKFSVDSSESPPEENTNPRSRVKLIFGNFNANAGQWANKPISTFPINVETIFSHLRQVRSVGDFSSTVNAFISQINRSVHELENYDADTSGGEEIRYRIQTGEIKYNIYPDPTDSSSWIMYVFDNKVSTVLLRNAFDALSSENPPTRDQVKEMLENNGIPWVEMGGENSILKEINARTQTDDILAAHNIIAGNRSSSNVRDMDASVDIPAGISRDFFSSAQMRPQNIIRSAQYVAPIQVSVVSMVLPTANYMGPIFIFSPIRTHSGIYLISQIRHDIKQQGASSNFNLIINTSLYNNIAV